MCLVCIVIFFSIIGYCTSDSDNTSSDDDVDVPKESAAYVMGASMIKTELSKKSGFNEIDTPFMDYNAQYINDSSYLIVSHLTYKNDFGVEKRLNYKARVKWDGGKEESQYSWELLYIEEFNPQ